MGTDRPHACLREAGSVKPGLRSTLVRPVRQARRDYRKEARNARRRKVALSVRKDGFPSGVTERNVNPPEDKDTKGNA
jgi:hypothetical protein